MTYVPMLGGTSLLRRPDGPGRLQTDRALKLPNATLAEVPPAKVRDYLLSETHPEGRFKARFFRSVGLGESVVLAGALMDLSRRGDVSSVVSTAYGRLYVVDGSVVTPDGTLVALRSVWIVEHGTRAPRLVTAYPE